MKIAFKFIGLCTLVLIWRAVKKIAISLKMSLFAFLATIFALWMVQRWFRRRRLPPGPPSIPILGCVPFVYPKKVSLSLFTSDKMCKKYGNVVMFETGIRQFVVLNDFNQVLIT